ncbi:MAG: hypothetical protein ACREOR_08995, partial [Candidatus Binatia bacterium]
MDDSNFSVLPRKKLDKSRPNREDMDTIPGNSKKEMIYAKLPSFDSSRIDSVLAVILTVLILAGCSTTDSPVASLFSPPPSFGSSPTAVAARSPSAMEALSRG